MRGKWELFVIVTGSLIYIFDVGFDIYVGVTYYKKEDFWWFGITIALVILPSIFVNMISYAVNMRNSENVGGEIKSLACLLQLAIIQQNWEALKNWKRTNCDNEPKEPCNKNNYNTCSCKKCKSYLAEKKKSAEYAVLLLAPRYIEAFAEAAPQWCLQNYIMLRQWSFPWTTIASTVFSLLSLAWSITSIEKSNKITDNPSMTFPIRSLMVFLVWQLGLLVSRLTAIVIFAYIFRQYVFIIIGVHWAAIIVVIFINQYHNEDRNCDVAVGNVFFTSYPCVFHVSGVTSGLMFQYLSKKTTKILNVILYTSFLLENVIMVSFSVWYQPTSPHTELLKKIALPLVFGGFAIGTSFGALYYKFFHPSKVAENKAMDETSRVSEPVEVTLL